MKYLVSLITLWK